MQCALSERPGALATTGKSGVPEGGLPRSAGPGAPHCPSPWGTGLPTTTPRRRSAVRTCPGRPPSYESGARCSAQRPPGHWHRPPDTRKGQGQRAGVVGWVSRWTKRCQRAVGGSTGVPGGRALSHALVHARAARVRRTPSKCGAERGGQKQFGVQHMLGRHEEWS